MPTGQMSEVLRRLCESVRARDGAGLSDGQLLESFIARRDEIAFEALVRRQCAPPRCQFDLAAI
jgi:hypothetical protein